MHISTPHLHKPIQPSVKLLTPYWHLHGIERVLHDIVGVQFVYLLHHAVDVRLLWLGEEEEFGTGERLEALHAEVRRFEDFDARCAGGEGRGRENGCCAVG